MKKVLHRSRFRIWKSARLAAEGMITANDGLHLGPSTLKHHVQVKETALTWFSVPLLFFPILVNELNVIVLRRC